MKLLIAGSRSITDFELAPYIPSDTDTIISGGAAGVDGVAERYADAHGLGKMIVRPQYDRYGRAAPIKRNEQMVDMADEVLVIWDGKSKGSMHTIRYAEKVRKPLRVVCEGKERAYRGVMMKISEKFTKTPCRIQKNAV